MDTGGVLRPRPATHKDDRRHERLTAVPYFVGLITWETDALIESFLGEPELHHPVRGRVKGADAFVRFVSNTNTWIAARNVTIEDVNFIFTPRRGIEEVVLHVDGDDGRIELPLALAADRDQDGRILEVRVYFSTWPLTGAHATRPPLLQPIGGLHEADHGNSRLMSPRAEMQHAAGSVRAPRGT